MHGSDKQYDADYIELIGRQPSLDFNDKDVRDDQSVTSNNSSNEHQAMLPRRYSDLEALNEPRTSLSSTALLVNSNNNTDNNSQNMTKDTTVAKVLAWQVNHIFFFFAFDSMTLYNPCGPIFFFSSSSPFSLSFFSQSVVNF